MHHDAHEQVLTTHKQKCSRISLKIEAVALQCCSLLDTNDAILRMETIGSQQPTCWFDEHLYYDAFPPEHKPPLILLSAT
jgi:hypothetical protein